MSNNSDTIIKRINLLRGGTYKSDDKTVMLKRIQASPYINHISDSNKYGYNTVPYTGNIIDVKKRYNRNVLTNEYYHKWSRRNRSRFDIKERLFNSYTNVSLN